MRLPYLLSFLAAAFLPNISLAQGPESNASPVERAQQIRDGASVWNQHCARCHDFNRWRRAFDAYGGDIRERELAWHGNTELLAHYVINYMPFDMPNTLSLDEYHAVLAYLLNRVDLLPEDVVVAEETYKQIPLPDYMELSKELYGIEVD
jgi:mono/diheme cytochrome c family protein